MAPPATATASPRRIPVIKNEKENPFLITGRYGITSTSTSTKAGVGAGPSIPSNDDVFFINPSSRKSGHTLVHDGGRRLALGNRDTNNTTLTPNHHGFASVPASASTSKPQYFQRPPVPAFHTSIPKPSPIPDVFSHSQAQNYPTTQRSTTSTKRSAETGHEGERSKRRVLEDLRLQEQRAARLDEQEKWRIKWLKSFPTLTFHFEMEAQEGPGRLLKARTTKMGAKVEQFFSAKVTHLIVKTVTSPSKTKPPPIKSLRGSPKHPFRDPSTAGSTLAEKAEQLNIKVWTLKKLSDILDRLAPIGHGSAANPHNSLSTLLEDERLHGTRERDANAPRPDWYYFRPGSKYLLVEDAVAKHRTILVKEYQTQAQASKTGSSNPTGSTHEYPILYESFLKRTTSCESVVPINQIRDRAFRLYVDRLPWKGEQPPGPLKRSTSLASIHGTPSVPETLPYQLASGNSVHITSNVASTSTANHSPAFGNGVPAFGAPKGPMGQMSRRVQVLKDNAAKRSSHGLPSNQFKSIYQSPVPAPAPPPIHTHTSSTALGSRGQRKTFMTQDQVVAMLRKQRAPVEDDPEVTTERRIRNREKVEAGYRGIKEQDTSAGYCENCRLRFDDLSVHLASKKHRRFATTPANFTDLDSLLKLLRRQINPHFAHDDIPYAPCWDEHDKDYPCEKCCMVYSDDDGMSGTESATGTGTGTGNEEWGVQSTTSSGSSLNEHEAEDEQEEEEDEDEGPGVVIAGQGEDEDYFDESAEGKEFELDLEVGIEV